jgi:hypothetical protein
MLTITNIIEKINVQTQRTNSEEKHEKLGILWFN